MADSAETAPRPVETNQPEPFGPILDRPPVERGREFKYRFAQSVVFGLPVLALQWFGRSLGGPESDRWVTLFQALLAGWVIYVAAAGMLTEAALLLLARRRLPALLVADAVAGGIALLLYLFGLSHFVAPAGWPVVFHWSVLLLMVWAAARWRQAKKNSAG